ncbi:NAD(P)-dependent oxidoreductase [Marinomonas balearica]|uniref:S-adenosyl-L-homocysteine hydrolase n=1 Tax=Marinomonas balearica TaxID=491947 RepID=A0A4R6M4E3_9GAMM|nr:NAD(P)-dependent oxidoreductase [Marinomonas balearica]TDO95370.1 S-adenosyl-L-homocysteine hydrolase [Marinomonas balearica]
MDHYILSLKKQSSFFNNSARQVKTQRKVAFILVYHLIPNMTLIIDGLKNIGRVAAIVPKGDRTKDLSFLGKDHKLVSSLGKEDIHNNPKIAIEFLKKKILPDEEIILMDHGGYFAKCLDIFHEDIFIQKKIIGILETTENGHQKYERSLQDLNIQNKFNIISLARSYLKSMCDEYIAKKIVKTTDTILADNLSIHIERKKVIGIIGFGKIGKGIARSLDSLPGPQKVLVYDKDEIRNMEAYINYDIATSLEELLEKSDVIFSSTGSGAISNSNIHLLKDSVCIVSCTSFDDEFGNLSLLRKEKNSHEIAEYNEHGKNIFFVCNGNSVNFSRNVAGDPFLYCWLASKFFAIKELLDKEEDSHKEISCISEFSEREVLSLWKTHFKAEN